MHRSLKVALIVAITLGVIPSLVYFHYIDHATKYVARNMPSPIKPVYAEAAQQPMSAPECDAPFTKDLVADLFQKQGMKFSGMRDIKFSSYDPDIDSRHCYGEVALNGRYRY